MAQASSIEKEDVPEEFLRFYELIVGEKLGFGGFGTVFEATDNTNQRVAIKVLERKGHVERESIPYGYSHENVIEVKAVWRNPVEYHCYDSCLVMQRCDTSLHDYMLRQKETLDVSTQHKLKTDIMKGLQFLHENRIVHRDVKPNNILIMLGNGFIKKAKLADFGLAKELSEGISYMASVLGSDRWMAPEVLKGNKYRKKVDIWSSGKVFLYISLDRNSRHSIAQQKCGEKRQHKAIDGHERDIDDPRSIHLIRDMMMTTASQRPEASEIIERLKKDDGSTGSNPSDQGPSPHLRYLNEDLSRQPNLSQPSPGTIIGSFAESDSNSSSYEDYQQNIPRDFLPQDSSNRSISYPRIVVTGGAALHPQTANIVPNTDMFCLTNQGEWIPKSDFDLKTALPLIAPIDRGFAALGGYAYGNQMMTTQIYNVNRSQNSVSGIRVSSAKLHAISYCRHAGLVESQGVLYVIGGVNENETVTTEVKKVNLMTADSQWVPCQPCPLPITWPIVTSGEGLIYIIKNTCAYNQQIRISQTPIKMYMYNTGNDRWRESTQLRQDILSTAGASLIFNEGFLYLLGGEGRLCERFSTEYRGWEPIPEKPLLPHGFAPCVIQQDRVFLLGGYGSQGTIEEFSLVTGKWTVWDVRMPKELVYHSATIV